MIAPDTVTLIQAAQAGDKEACGRLVEENLGLIWSIVKRYTRKTVDNDDLYQLGCLGFLKAVQGFDTQFGTQFSTYAVPKIAGEIRRFLRDDGMVKVGRGRKEQALLIHRARTQLTGPAGPGAGPVRAGPGHRAHPGGHRRGCPCCRLRGLPPG